MSNDSNRLDANDNYVAMLGLLAQTGEASAQAPDEEELRAYLRGETSPDRSDEIRSHIANDPDVADLVLELSEASDTVVHSGDRFAQRRLANKRNLFAGIAALAASVLVAVFVVEPVIESPDPQRVRVVRSDTGAGSERQHDLDAIRLGYASGSASSGFSVFGNALVADCAGDCNERQKLRQYGALLNNLEKSCRPGASGRVTRDARESLQGLVSGSGAITGSPWRGYVMDLKRASDQSDAALCRVALKMTDLLKTD